jgi:hypothetical protein
MVFDGDIRMESLFKGWMDAFPKPVVFFHYNFTEKKLLM